MHFLLNDTILLPEEMKILPNILTQEVQYSLPQKVISIPASSAVVQCGVVETPIADCVTQVAIHELDLATGYSPGPTRDHLFCNELKIP
jgi:hypothetical protein